MIAVDGGLSGAWMAWTLIIAASVTVLVMNRHYSFCNKRLFLPGFQGKRPASSTGRTASFKWIDACFQSVTSVH
jgi:hypothetical protein